MTIPTSKWKTIERPGWFGEARDEVLAGYDQKHGKGNWRLRHKLGPQTLDFNQSVNLYEMCYEFDFNHPDRKFLFPLNYTQYSGCDANYRKRSFILRKFWRLGEDTLITRSFFWINSHDLAVKILNSSNNTS